MLLFLFQFAPYGNNPKQCEQDCKNRSLSQPGCVGWTLHFVDEAEAHRRNMSPGFHCCTKSSAISLDTANFNTTSGLLDPSHWNPQPSPPNPPPGSAYHFSIQS